MYFVPRISDDHSIKADEGLLEVDAVWKHVLKHTAYIDGWQRYEGLWRIWTGWKDILCWTHLKPERSKDKKEMKNEKKTEEVEKNERTKDNLMDDYRNYLAVLFFMLNILFVMVIFALPRYVDTLIVVKT